jgi:RsiW-degrading membrane proteinase PrsW (M82 family)
MFLSVPAHGAFGALMGYFVGLARFNQHNNTHGLLLKGLVTATFFHGTFDVFLLLKENNIVKQHVSGLLLLLGALVSYFFSIRFSLRAIQLHRELSRLNKEKELFTE